MLRAVEAPAMPECHPCARCLDYFTQAPLSNADGGSGRYELPNEGTP